MNDFSYNNENKKNSVGVSRRTVLKRFQTPTTLVNWHHLSFYTALFDEGGEKKIFVKI